MTISLFIMILTIGSIVSSLLTEAIKKAYTNAKKEYSANMIALINAVIIGGFGTIATYVFLNAEWTVPNILCIIFMIACVWVGSMIGYDKVIQLVKQLSGSTSDTMPKSED